MNLMNRVVLIGVLKSDFVFSHRRENHNIYQSTVCSKRYSGFLDEIPVFVSEEHLNASLQAGDKVQIFGQYRSNNYNKDGNRHLGLYVSAFAVRKTTHTDNNHIQVDGYVCNTPFLRETPGGRKITEVKIAVNRSHNISDYLPCIFWEKDAEAAAQFAPGDHVTLEGRIQSRIYYPKAAQNDNSSDRSDGKGKERIAYEVSVRSFLTDGTNNKEKKPAVSKEKMPSGTGNQDKKPDNEKTASKARKGNLEEFRAMLHKLIDEEIENAGDD